MKQEELIVGRWYSGFDRFVGGIGLWNGHVFMGVVFKFGYYSDSAEGFDPVNEYELLFKDYTGRELYELQRRKFAECGVVTDDWDDLEATDQRVWSLTAIELMR